VQQSVRDFGSLIEAINNPNQQLLLELADKVQEAR
jgi:hypothetical protein